MLIAAKLVSKSSSALLSKGLLKVIVKGLFSVALLASATIQTASAQCSTACTLIWQDEFDGVAVDTAKWSFQIGDGTAFGIPGWGNNEQQYYRAENATVAAGELTITAKQENFGGKSYTSSRMRTIGLGDWTYGRFETRAKLPSGQGLWPAFWMLSSDPSTYGFWPASGEIDILESKGANPETIYTTLHYGTSYALGGNGSTFQSNTTVLANPASNFHTYAVEWEPSQFRWYIDGVLVHSVSGWFSSGGPFPAPFDQPFHMLLNFAVGGNFVGNPAATTFPKEFIVDYVRVYSLPDTVIPVESGDIVFDDMEHGAPSASDWFAFGSPIGGGGIDANNTDLPPQDGGVFSLQTGWGSGGTPGYLGAFGRNKTMDLTGIERFSFWINPDAGQDYALEINIQDDDTGDSVWTQNLDDEFQFTCVISATGPCAIAGGGWQKIIVPLSDFVYDTSFSNGGSGVLDTVPNGNGQALNMTVAVITNSGGDVNFRTDYWFFQAEIPQLELPAEESIPLPWIAIAVLAALLVHTSIRVRRIT